MEIKISIQSAEKRKEPIEVPVSFPVTRTQKAKLEEIRQLGTIDLNETVRKCLDQIISQALPEKL